MIALVDCNNFYCSCERLFEPKLVDRPLMVLSSNDGCVVARSNEVKALGILTGTPLFQVRELVRRHNIVVRSSNFSLYGDMSWRVMRTLEQLCADVEIYSIDEAFLHVDAPEEALLELGRKARRTVLQHTGIPVSVGIGPTKTLAKAASKLAKSDPEGVFSVIDSAVRDAALERLPVEHVWGVGPAYAKTLAREGITTARALRDADLAFVRKKITVGGVRTVMELRGQPSFHRGDEPRPGTRSSAPAPSASRWSRWRRWSRPWPCGPPGQRRSSASSVWPRPKSRCSSSPTATRATNPSTAIPSRSSCRSPPTPRTP